MSLRLRLILAFAAVASLLLVVSATSLYVNHSIQSQVADLRSSRGVDLRHVEIESVSLEVEGFWDRGGLFVATDVEVLPGTRRPKLRGEIQSVDHDRRTVTLYGVVVYVSAETEFIDAPAETNPFEDLRAGQRIEVSCHVVEGRWTARKIKTRGVKGSDKIKGTVTAAELDGSAPETVAIHGLVVSIAPRRTDSPNGALRRIKLATQMTLLLQESRVAASEMVGRTRAWRYPVGAEELDPENPASTANERLARAEGDFEYYLEESLATDTDAAGSSLPDAFAPWLRSLTEEQATFRGHVRTLEKLANTDADRAIRFLDDVFDPFLQNDLLPVVYAYRSAAEEALADQVHAISARTDTTAQVALVTSAVAVILATVLGASLWRSIHTPIRSLCAAAQRLGQGHLDTRVDVRSRDELGVLAEAFNKMAGELATTMVSVSNLESVFDSMAGALVIFDPAGRITNVNRAALDLLGHERADVVGQPFERICLTPPNGPSLQIVRATDDGIVANEEKVFLKSDGSTVPVSFSGAELRSNGGSVRGYVCVAQDVTERKRIEERLRNSLADKELLLREVHHRVKNNMQVITSLLAIQSRYTTDAEVLEKLEQSQSRIRSMALIHEQLHQTAGASELDLRAYLGMLTEHLLESFTGHSSVTLELQVEQLSSNIDQALACGLIVNELMTNSLKHAFPDHAEGKIWVSLFEDRARNRVLSVTDNGCGLPDDLDPTASRALGLALVAELVRKLRGRASFAGTTGTDVRIVFPRDDSERLTA